MSKTLFDSLEHVLNADGSAAALEYLVARVLEEKNYTLYFEARMMQMRHELGLPLLRVESIASLPAAQQPAYEAAMSEAARDTGNLFLEAGEVVRAWPYFRAIGEPAPVAAAIERVQPGEGIDAVLEIALHEGVHPCRGFELLLQTYGVCRAIEFTTRYTGDPVLRRGFIGEILHTMYRELTTSIREAIAAATGSAPDSDNLIELIRDRQWLFDNTAHYIENSHLASIVQLSTELEDPALLQLAIELTEYAERLSPILQFEGQPPFERTHLDYGLYLRALAGRDTDAAISHFRQKVDGDVPGAAEALIALLSRLGRHREALEISVRYLDGKGGYGCPSAIDLCDQAGDYCRLAELGRQHDDVLAFTAGLVKQLTQGSAKTTIP